MCKLPRPSCFSHASLVLLSCRNITGKNSQLLYPFSSTIMMRTSKTIRIISIRISTIIILLITMLKVTWESLLSRGRTKTPRPKGLRLFLEQVAFSYFAICIFRFYLIIFVFLFVVRHRFANGKFFNRSKNKWHLARRLARQRDTKILIYMVQWLCWHMILWDP